MSPAAAPLQQAADHLRYGQWRDAEAVLRDWLATHPGDAQANYLLAVAVRGQQQFDEAAEYFHQAALADPTQAEYLQCWAGALCVLGQFASARQASQQALALERDCVPAYYHLGKAEQGLGNLAGAATAFRELLARAPEHVETHNDLATVLRATGQRDEAERHLHRAIELRPDFAEALNNLGTLLEERGDPRGAIETLSRAVALRPDVAIIHYNLGNAWRAAGEQARAALEYREATRLDPRTAAAFNNLGLALLTLGDLPGAAVALSEAVRLEPDLAEACFNLAQVRQKQSDLPAARDLYQRALALRPDHAAGHYNLGTVLHALRDWPAAEACYREAIRLDPHDPLPHVNLGTIRQALGNDDEALARFDAALAIDPESAEAHCNLGMLRLSQGDFAGGWPEYRWLARCVPARPMEPQPTWDGSPLAGRRLLIRCDQGTGDALQFIRYLPRVREQFSEVYVSAAGALHPLLRCCGVEQLVTPASLPEFDLQVSIMLLPAYYYDQVGTLADTVPYLRPDEAQVAEWRQWLSGLSGLKVGICWQGNRRFAWDHLRSVALSEFSPLAALKGVSLVSLQRGEGSEQLAEQQARMRIVDLPPTIDGERGAFIDTASVMECLDLVVTTDTAIAHLSGAMGKPTWVATSHVPEWRWQRHGESSPWYPSVRLFRQRQFGDWAEVFSRMARELVMLAETPRG